MIWQRIFVSRQRSQGLLRFEDLYGRERGVAAGGIIVLVIVKGKMETSGEFSSTLSPKILSLGHPQQRQDRKTSRRRLKAVTKSSYE